MTPRNALPGLLALGLTTIGLAQQPEKVGAGSATEVARFRALLEELRELQTAAAREEAAWRVEEQNLKQLTEVTHLQVSETRDELGKLRAGAESLDKELDEARTREEEAKPLLAALRGELGKCASQLRDRCASGNVPPPQQLKQGADRLAEELSGKGGRASELVGELWALALEWLAWAGEVDAKHSQETIGGTARDVHVLRLGNVAQYAVADDGSAAWAWKSAFQSWDSIDPQHGPELIRAVDVVRKRRAADVVLMPLTREATP